MKGCIHSLCDRSARCYTWRGQKRCSRTVQVQKRRQGWIAAASSSDFDAVGTGYGNTRVDVADDPMRKILEEFGLEVDMLFRDAQKHDMEQLEAGWDEEAGMYDWEKPVESSELCEPTRDCIHVTL
jgi:hypothetical protein